MYRVSSTESRIANLCGRSTRPLCRMGSNCSGKPIGNGFTHTTRDGRRPGWLSAPASSPRGGSEPFCTAPNPHRSRFLRAVWRVDPAGRGCAGATWLFAAAVQPSCSRRCADARCGAAHPPPFLGGAAPAEMQPQHGDRASTARGTGMHVRALLASVRVSHAVEADASDVQVRRGAWGMRAPSHEAACSQSIKTPFLHAVNTDRAFRVSGCVARWRQRDASAREDGVQLCAVSCTAHAR